MAAKKEGIVSHSTVGFKRLIDHVDGNWPSYVYLLVPKSRRILSIAHACLSHYVQSGGSQMSLSEDFHISLTRPFVLRFHQIEPFLRSLARKITLLEGIIGTKTPICNLFLLFFILFMFSRHSYPPQWKLIASILR